MGIWCGALVETRALLRRRRTAGALLFVGWLVLVRAQQPTGLRTDSFYWPSVEAAWLLVMALLPLVWIAGRGRTAAVWLLRVSRRPLDGLLSVWLGIILCGLAATTVAAFLSLAVCRIYESSLALDRGFGLAATLLVLAPLAALAPGLCYLGLRLPTVTLVWSLVLVGCLVRGVPAPGGALLIQEGTDLNQSRWPLAILSSALATGGGLLLSLALSRRQLAPTTCASGS